MIRPILKNSTVIILTLPFFCFLDNEGLAVVDAKQNKTTWGRSRRHEISYTPADDVYSTISTHKIDVSGKTKRMVVALSDLHLGGSWAKGMDGKLEAFMESLITTASEQVGTVNSLILNIKVTSAKLSGCPSCP